MLNLTCDFFFIIEQNLVNLQIKQHKYSIKKNQYGNRHE